MNIIILIFSFKIFLPSLKFSIIVSLTFFETNNIIYLLCLFASVGVIGSIFGVVRKNDLISSYIISVGPSIIIAISFYESLKANVSILPLTIFVCLFLLSVKYGLRVIRIVGCQKYNEDNEINNNKKKAWGHECILLK